MGPSHEDLHIFFLPFLCPGHMIPMVDLATIFASRGVRSTIVTTTGNAPLIQPTIDRRCISNPSNSIQLLTLHLPASSVENVSALPSPALLPDLVDAVDSLNQPFRALVDEHRPDAIVSDVFYPWTADCGVPMLLFYGTNAFSSVVIDAFVKLDRAGGIVGQDEAFVVPGMPHRIELTKSQMMDRESKAAMKGLGARMFQSVKRSYGMLLNTVHDLEPEYVAMTGSKAWCVGPVSLCNRDAADKAVRGGGGSPGDNVINSEHCLNWLDGKKPGSVLYVCFGSLGRFTPAQLREIAGGLEGSGHPFVWAIKNCGDREEEWMPEGFEERGKGLIVRGWAPQILMLSHPAIGGFMTHCGWNSCLEGACAGLPMATWPLFAEQFLNEKLLVDILRIGVSVGAKLCSFDEKRRGLVKSDEVRNAVEELMGSGEEAGERRERAKEVAETAIKAAEEGGSSYNGVSRLIQELVDIKTGKIKLDADLI